MLNNMNNMIISFFRERKSPALSVDIIGIINKYLLPLKKKIYLKELLINTKFIRGSKFMGTKHVIGYKHISKYDKYNNFWILDIHM
jgi:hypothetical protein